MITPIGYPPGSQWLYLKVYGGPQALEEWLINPIREKVLEWHHTGMISRFHFIRYIDPDYHLRLRFYLPDPGTAGRILREIAQSCRDRLEEERIWNIEASTYQPEFKRYGENRIQLIEDWFSDDSLFWINLLYRARQIPFESIWKPAMWHVSRMLEVFFARADEKNFFLRRLSNLIMDELGVNHHLKSRLDEKYRKESDLVAAILNYQDEQVKPLVSVCPVSLSTLAELSVSEDETSNRSRQDLLADLVHMSLNRAFRSHHRAQEMVLYDFMARFYHSVAARSKDK